jgi:MFS family permease
MVDDSVPFLLLAVGQVIGSILAGWFIGTWGYATSFTLYGFVGILATLLGPKENKKESIFNMNRKKVPNL